MPVTVDMTNHYSELECELYVPSRSFAFPTDAERATTCSSVLGPTWMVDPTNQDRVRVGFVRCIPVPIEPRQMPPTQA